MIRPQTFGTILAIGALTVLPACSMFGGGQQAAPYRHSSAATTGTRSARQTAENTMPPVVSHSMLRKVQGTLKQDRLYRGRVDGVWGPMTEHAVMRYQHQHNLDTTGKLDLPTLQAMNETGNNSRYSEATGGRNPPGSDMAANPGANAGSGNMTGGHGPNAANGDNTADNGRTAPGGPAPNYATGPSHQTGGAYQSAGNQPANGSAAQPNQGPASGTTNAGNGQNPGGTTGR